MRHDNILEAIGHTPLVEIARMSPNEKVRIFAKMEGQNLGGSASVKDRTALYLINQAEISGELTKDRTILEATSGNTGIALAMIGQRKGYKVKIVMPENVSIERRQLLQLYGAEMILIPGRVTDAIECARSIAAKDGRYFVPDQFSNPANPLAHYETTGAEILKDMSEKIDIFVCGIGTGGTITGAGRRLKEHNPSTKVIGVEPPPNDPIQGLRSLAEGFVPPVLDLHLLDEKVIVPSREAGITANDLLQKEGIFAGLSSGAAVYMAIEAAKKMDHGNIVVLVPDAGWKYLSIVPFSNG